MQIMLSVLSLVFHEDLDPAGGFKQLKNIILIRMPILIALKVGSRLNNSSSASQNDALSLAH
jgi:hypothetical protein